MDRARWRKLIGMIDDYDESSGWMFLLVPAHPGFPGQIPQSLKRLCVLCVFPWLQFCVAWKCSLFWNTLYAEIQVTIKKHCYQHRHTGCEIATARANIQYMSTFMHHLRQQLQCMCMLHQSHTLCSTSSLTFMQPTNSDNDNDYLPLEFVAETEVFRCTGKCFKNMTQITVAQHNSRIQIQLTS